MSSNYTAFIFARGGSKGVKDKNIREVAGKPLIAYSIEEALKSKYISRVVVSTDSLAIAEIAKKYGADVLERPSNLAGDKSAEILSWKHAIDNFQDSLQGVFISLPATSPLRKSIDVNNAVEKYEKYNCDILFGICPSHRNPYLNMVKKNDEGYIEILNKGSTAIRRQDVPEVFDITTCVYVGNVDYIKVCESLMEGNVGYVDIPFERSIDIDTEFDLYLADLMLKTPFETLERE